jgi:hypothetical protein
MRSAIRVKTVARSAGAVVRQALKARLAAVTARSISSAPPRATAPSDRPVDGSTLSYTCGDATDSPSMNDCVRVPACTL